MAGKNNNIDDLKLHFDSLFCFASQVPFTNNHPLPVIQAVKSLIGINPEEPPPVLLKWLEIYIKNFNLEIKNIKTNNLHEIEVVNIANLGDSINDNNKTKALGYLRQLTRVASVEYIAEYLMELATNKSSCHILFCWNIFKTIRHAKEEELYPLLELSVACLLDMGKNKNPKDCELLFYYKQINKTPLIRSSTFFPKLDEKINSIRSIVLSESETLLPENILNYIIKYGIIGLSDSLKQLSIDELNSQMLLRLDSMRSNIQYSNNKKEFLFDLISNKRGGENVK